jgi:hypothetical protein
MFRSKDLPPTTNHEAASIAETGSLQRRLNMDGQDEQDEDGLELKPD